MELREYIAKQMNITHQAMQRILEGIGEAESLIRIEGKSSHIRWIAGHNAYSAWMRLGLLDETEKLPEGWKQIFRGGSEILKDASQYPSLQEISALTKEIDDKAERAIAQVSDSDLEQRKTMEDWEARVGDALLFLCQHEFYHVGQIAMIRRLLGRERLFG